MAMSQDWYRDKIHLTEALAGVSDLIENTKGLFMDSANIYETLILDVGRCFKQFKLLMDRWNMR